MAVSLQVNRALTERLEERRLLTGTGPGGGGGIGGGGEPYVETAVWVNGGDTLDEEAETTVDFWASVPGPGDGVEVTFAYASEQEIENALGEDIEMATEGEDFSKTGSFTVTIPAGAIASTGRVTIEAIDDAETEVDEYLGLKIVSVQPLGQEQYGFDPDAVATARINETIVEKFDTEWSLEKRPTIYDSSNIIGGTESEPVYEVPGWKDLSRYAISDDFGKAAQLTITYMQSQSVTFGVGGSVGVDLSGLGVPFSAEISGSRSHTDTNGVQESHVLGPWGGQDEPDTKYWISAFIKTQNILIVHENGEFADFDYHFEYIHLGFHYLFESEVWKLDRHFVDPDDARYVNAQPAPPTEAQTADYFFSRPSGALPNGATYTPIFKRAADDWDGTRVNLIDLIDADG